MNRNTIRFIIILAALVIVSITISQFVFLNKAFEFQERVSDLNIKVALQRVQREILKTHSEKSEIFYLKQLSPNYFVVNLDTRPDPEILKALLKKEFERMEIMGDFQFAIYDTTQKKLIFGDYVSLHNPDRKAKPVKGLPKYNSQNYYFCVYFPFKHSNILREMGTWMILSCFLVFTVLFFAYSIYVIIRQKRLSEIQKDFINNMTHEFQTPISTISISSEALKDPKMIESKERIINYASIIHDEALRLKKQVESILQVERINKERLSINKEVINVNKHIQSSIERIQTLAGVKNNVFTLSLNAKPPEILADPVHFHNIIFNIIENAIKYSNENPVIKIETVNEKDCIRISIGDNGIGIDKKEAKRIFEKFYRIPDKNVRNIKGFGIGLYYVRLLVRAHGGRINLESVPGKGSTFSIYMLNPQVSK
jgi:two-component system, OmpR family, phosphate regulon sensor histidine kinase PhoR